MILRRFICLQALKMDVFVQKVNPITGTDEWVVQNEDYDYHQEVARSSFADMLHDTERNQLYEKALKIAIDKMHSGGRKANVLDIGTGTGLLSMMAARNNADSIVACEAFKPMSECAKQIIKANGFENRIKVIPKRSTELTVGENCDLKEKCNILVTEVFDTELIGEGALSTFSHAHKCLLEKDCIIIPESATIYAQVVECPLAQNWNKPKDIFSNDLDLLIQIPESIKKCAGSAAVHDLQLSQLPSTSFNTILPPMPVLRFDWSGRTPFVFQRSTISNVKSNCDGMAQMVFIWWDLQMDINGKHILSCAPHWAHRLVKEKTESKIPWRDHWMQAIYYFPQEIKVKKGQEINLISCHDEYSLWFNLSTDLKLGNEQYLSPVCHCGFHVALSRTRIGQMNDMTRNKKFMRIIEDNTNENSVVLVMSNLSYFGLVASKLGANKVYILETNMLLKRILNDIIGYNKLGNIEILDSVDDFESSSGKQINLVFGEPYFTSSILPWDNLLFLHYYKKVKHLLAEEHKIYPQKCQIKAVPVRFDDLHKIRAPLGQCEGFTMTHFDELIEKSSKISDSTVEPQPLWEYPCVALGSESTITHIDFTQDSTDKITKGVFEIIENTPCNGIAIWVEWLSESPRTLITTGPIVSIEVGRKIHWDMYTRQGVCLFTEKLVKTLDWEFSFTNGNINFNCK